MFTFLDDVPDGVRLVDCVPDKDDNMYPLEEYMAAQRQKLWERSGRSVYLEFAADERRFVRRKKEQDHLQPYLLTTYSKTDPHDFLLLAAYFCRLLSQDYVVVTEMKTCRYRLDFLTNYLMPWDEPGITYSAATFGYRLFLYKSDKEESVRFCSVAGRKDHFAYFPYWRSHFTCSDGFYAGAFLLFGDYWLKYRRWPGVLLGLLTFIVPYDVTGCWLEKPLGIKVYQRAEKDFPDYTQEVLYYREQKSVAEFRYSTPISRLQVWIDGVNITERDLADCVDQTVKWANCL